MGITKAPAGMETKAGAKLPPPPKRGEVYVDNITSAPNGEREIIMWIYKDENGIPHIEIGPMEIADNIPGVIMEALQANSCPFNINPMIDEIGAILKEHGANEIKDVKQSRD